MVLERIVPEEWLERKAQYAFLLGAFYGVIGIALARLLFASDPAIPAVAFTSIFLLPELYRIFAIEEKQQAKERKLGLRVAWRDNGDFFKVYLSLFLGILLVTMVAAMLLPSLAVNSLFRDQLAMRSDSFIASGNAISGEATGTGLFTALLTNNAIVMIAVFFVALLAGDGAIFLITWNATLWGAIFGVTARNAAYSTQGEPFLYFMQIIATVTPHVLLEASTYILAAMAGGMLSRAIVTSGWGSATFKRVLAENSVIIALAIGTLVLGAFVETVVLNTSESYARLVQLALTGVR